MKRILLISACFLVTAIVSSIIGAITASNYLQQKQQPVFTQSELPGGGLKLPKNERLHLSTDQRWIESEGHLSDLIRLQWKGDRAKPAIVWVDEKGKDKGAIITHDKANNPEAADHKHLSIETTMSPDGEAANQLFTRMEFPYDEDVSEINTHSSNFTVRSGVVRVTGEEGQNKEFRIQKENSSKTGVSRWSLRANNTHEEGNNSGSDFQIIRFDDQGAALDAPLGIQRSSGNIGIHTDKPERRLDINDDRLRIREAYTPASSTSPGLKGDLAWDDRYIYICVADNQWKRTALESW